MIEQQPAPIGDRGEEEGAARCNGAAIVRHGGV
jgi:hypothetical protein